MNPLEKKQIELIDKSLIELEKLKSEVNKLEEIRRDIEETKTGVVELPKKFNETFEKAIEITEGFVENLGKAVRLYIDGSNTLFATNLNELSNKTNDIEKRIDDLKKQVERLEKIDLEKHFDKLQKTLSEIFGAINAINLTLTNIVQTLTGIVQTLGNIQTTLDTNHKEVKQLINSFSVSTEKHLNDIDKQASKNVELIEAKIKSISEQNELLKKELKTNRIIQMIGFVIVISILIYLIVKQ